MSHLISLGPAWLNYLWVQSLNILPLGFIIVPFSLLFARKLPQVTFGLWIILLLRLIVPAEFGLTSIPFSSSFISDFEGEMLSFPQEYRLSHSPGISFKNEAHRGDLITPILVMLTLLGTTIKAGSIVYRRRKYSHLPLTPILDGPLHGKLISWRLKFNIHRNIQLFQSPHPYAPHTSGSLFPRIILPQNASGSGKHLDAILAHEMGHIARWDDLFILLSQAIMSLFFFHPLVWMAQHYLSESREMAVDQLILSRRYLSVTEYGSALIEAAVLPSARHLAIGFAAPKARIKKRIIALKGKKVMQTRTARLILILSLPLFGISWIAPETGIQQTSSASTQFIAPLKDMRITSAYGDRMHPIKKKMMHHGGIDLAGKTGTPVMATADGVVSSAKFEKGWGNTIRLEHGGDYSSVYAQLDKILVTENQHVKQGDIIGQVGSSGTSTGPHLHFEIRQNNERLDPADVLNL
jgi:murein DD-endopeptidase MepM/ murein hydrolase activator NlpD